MAIDTTLIDTEGFDWDIQSNPEFNGALGIRDGETDAFDIGMRLVVNGVDVNPQTASVDTNGREVNTAPQLINGIGVTRSILVSDASISAVGFARFLDSFTNTTNETVTITVQTVTNSGADADLVLPDTSSGDSQLDASDTGFTTSDFNPSGDTSVMIAYGDGIAAGTRPVSAGVGQAGGFNDNITVTHEITLAPGETRSLLQFATQNNDSAQAGADLGVFTQSLVSLNNAGFLAGLSRDELRSIHNYTGADAITDPFTLVDSDGNTWAIDLAGGLSTVNTTALQSFEVSWLDSIQGPTTGFFEDKANDEVTIFTSTIFGQPVTYTYRALPDQGVIRLVVTVSNPGSFTASYANGDITVISGANPALAPAELQANLLQGPGAGRVGGLVIDDSTSGSGGILPALTIVHGADDDSTASISGNTFGHQLGDLFLTSGETQSFLYFFALNADGLQSLLDLQRLVNPGPEALIGLSAETVGNIVNFGLSETDRLQLKDGTSDDDILIGNAWGDSINGGFGDDDISVGGSDDFAFGFDGDDHIDGGDGADSLFGGNQNDTITGGTDDDEMGGDDGDDRLLGQAGNDTMFGDTGIDTLSGGRGSDLLFGGADNDLLQGNIGDDILLGEDGNDTLDGGAGGDHMEGGTESDVYIVNSAADVVIEQAIDFGFDEVRSSVSFSVGGQSIELVTLNGTANINATGDIFANRLTGNDGTNTLTGNAGADTLDGGGGVDVLIGGNGGDVYVIDSITDTITETAGGNGIDEIRSSVDYTMNVANIELITLTGTADLIAIGTGAAERIVGNAGVNSINSFGGADTLEGGDGADIMDGGTEDDRMFGGGGDDDLFGDEGADSLDGGDGNDELFGNNGADTLLGGAGDDNLTGGNQPEDIGDRIFGGDGNDFLSGGAGIDTLNGDDGNDTLSGSEGADSLFGGAGNDELSGGPEVDTGSNQMSGGADGDIYFVNSASDVVIESALDTGIDQVVSIISYTLTDNVEELRLVVTGFGTNGTGNALDNRLTGSSDDNTLDGRGGADTMVGGNGNDTYVVDNVDDVVRESGGTSGGIDTVRSTIGYQLGDSVENLQLVGATRLNGTGNDAANSITGNAFANLLNGGLGNDTLTSGAGSDVFLFDIALGAGNVDHVTDFFVGRDVVYLDDAIFTELNLGRPPVFKFVNGTAALDADDRLMYDIATGTLRYDADGNAAGASVVVAVFDNNAALVNGSFLVI